VAYIFIGPLCNQDKLTCRQAHMTRGESKWRRVDLLSLRPASSSFFALTPSTSYFCASQLYTEPQQNWTLSTYIMYQPSTSGETVSTNTRHIMPTSPKSTTFTIFNILWPHSDLQFWSSAPKFHAQITSFTQNAPMPKTGKTVFGNKEQLK